MTKHQIHVAVLMGGWSSEREVSLRSGAACADALEGLGYRVTRLDVARDVAERLAEVKPDVCFSCLIISAPSSRKAKSPPMHREALRSDSERVVTRAR